MLVKYNGYLITSLVCSEDISKTYVAQYIKEHGMEKVSRGLYITDDVWPDELFFLQQRNGAVIYSGETALYLHGLTDREYSSVCVTVPQGYNASYLKNNDFDVSMKPYPQADLPQWGHINLVSSWTSEKVIFQGKRFPTENDEGNVRIFPLISRR